MKYTTRSFVSLVLAVVGFVADIRTLYANSVVSAKKFVETTSNSCLRANEALEAVGYVFKLVGEMFSNYF